MQIREATHDDVDQMAEMGRAFASIAFPGIEYSTDTAAAALHALIDNGFVLVLDDGQIQGAIGVALASIWCTAQPIASELFFWIQPDARGSHALRMIKEAERQAKQIGAVALVLADLPHTQTDASSLLSLMATQEVVPHYLCAMSQANQLNLLA